jgi:hypothetical protein
VLVAAAAVPMAATATAQAADAAKPKAVVPEAVHDAGVVPTGQQILHDFVIENQGNAALEITDVRPACGCTVAQFDRTIAPGASGKVHAVLDTSTFGGAIAKGITVLTNDPARPRLELTVKAEVRPHLIADPGFARFLQPQHSDPGVVEQRVWTKSFDKLEILGVTSPYPFLQVSHAPITDAADRHEDGLGPQHELTLVFDYSQAAGRQPSPSTSSSRPTTRSSRRSRSRSPASCGRWSSFTPRRPTSATLEARRRRRSTAAFCSSTTARSARDPVAAEATVPGVEVAIEPVTDGQRVQGAGARCRPTCRRARSPAPSACRRTTPASRPSRSLSRGTVS